MQLRKNIDINDARFEHFSGTTADDPLLVLDCKAPLTSKHIDVMEIDAYFNGTALKEDFGEVWRLGKTLENLWVRLPDLQDSTIHTTFHLAKPALVALKRMPEARSELQLKMHFAAKDALQIVALFYQGNKNEFSFRIGSRQGELFEEGAAGTRAASEPAEEEKPAKRGAVASRKEMAGVR